MSHWAEPTWIGSQRGRELSAWVHLPQERTARVGSSEKSDGIQVAAPQGVLILVPPTGRDLAVSYRSLRVLAARAARAGFVVVRFSFSGTGESMEAYSGGTSKDWQEDLDAVVNWARATFHTKSVGGIGLRLGASILAANENPHWAYRLLWDPVSGKRFLKQGSMLRAMSVPGEPLPGGVEHAGYRYTENHVAEIKALPKPKAPEWGQERGADRPRVFTVTNEPEEARLLYEVASIQSRVPGERIDKIIEAACALSNGEYPAAGMFVPRLEATFPGPGGRLLRESVVITEAGVPGVLTRPAEDRREDSARAAVFAAGSSEPKDGPTGMWTSEARRLAELGVIAFRAERPGCGDLGDLSADRDPNPHTAESIRSLDEAAKWVKAATGGRPVTGIGLCSGAWQLLCAAREGNIARVVAVNNVSWRTSLEFHRRIYDGGHLEVMPESDELVAVEGDLTPRRNSLGSLMTRTRNWLKTVIEARAPYGLWYLLGTKDLVNVPELLLKDIPNNVEIDLVYGPLDRRHFTEVRGDEGLVRVNAGRSRPVALVCEAELDHSLLGGRAREAMSRVLRSLDW